MQFIEMNLPERGKNRSWRTILVLSAFQSVLNSLSYRIVAYVERTHSSIADDVMMYDVNTAPSCTPANLW